MLTSSWSFLYSYILHIWRWRIYMCTFVS